MNSRTEGKKYPQRPLRTLFLATHLPVGGAERLLVDLVRGLNPAKIKPEIGCTKEAGPIGEMLAKEFPLHAHLAAGKYNPVVLHRLVRLMRQRRYDAVVTVGAGDKMFWGRIAAKLANIPVVVSALHSTGWPDGVGALNRILTPWTDAFVGVAESHGKYLIERERFPAHKVVVIRNGVDTDRFAPGPERARIRQELRIEPYAPAAAIVAALRPEKNHEMFLRVANIVRIQIPGAKFIVVGDGPEREKLQNLAARWGVVDDVRFLGSRDDVPAVLMAADVVLLTSHNEASPVSVLEAMACQRPVLSTQVGSVAESVRHGENGYLTPPNDADRMAQRLIRLFRSPAKIQRLGRNARDWVLKNASVTSMIEGYEEMILSIHAAKQKKPYVFNPARHDQDASPDEQLVGANI